MENNLTPELIEKAKSARSPEELISLAKENGLELTVEQASAYLGKINKGGELSDDELTDVAGGCLLANSEDPHVCLHIVKLICPQCKYCSVKGDYFSCDHPTRGNARPH